ncbi:uncharacterized protein LOC107262754 [Cephus cinctus]|uniref:Uncharacterized protein LOC107262754 n=1 Tax=Cephus cinctus TaxID=211228 RepID=A0AAJ7BFE4_CEPCN|nr:uncharacterized protein LOC107262754 [Cephus cinctus]
MGHSAVILLYINIVFLALNLGQIKGIQTGNKLYPKKYSHTILRRINPNWDDIATENLIHDTRRVFNTKYGRSDYFDIKSPHRQKRFVIPNNSSTSTDVTWKPPKKTHAKNIMRIKHKSLKKANDLSMNKHINGTAKKSIKEKPHHNSHPPSINKLTTHKPTTSSKVKVSNFSIISDATTVIIDTPRNSINHSKIN